MNKESLFKTNPLAEDSIWLYQMRNEENKGIPKNISTHKKKNKQLNIIEKDLFQIMWSKIEDMFNYLWFNYSFNIFLYWGVTRANGTAAWFVSRAMFTYISLCAIPTLSKGFLIICFRVAFLGLEMFACTSLI